MKKSLILASCAISILFALPSYALAPPPSELIEQTTTSKCIRITSSFLANQPSGSGTGSKGPAIEIENNCLEQFDISNIETSPIAADLKVAAPPYGVLIKTKDRKYYSVVYSPTGNKCTYPIDTSNTTQLCSNLIVSPEESLTIPMYWGSSFVIDGSLGKASFSTEGAIINPNNPTQAIPVELNKANSGDPEAAYRLATLYLKYGPTYNAQEAIHWLAIAIDKGNIYAKTTLAGIYFGDVPAHPSNPSVDYKMAAQLYLEIRKERLSRKPIQGPGLQTPYVKNYLSDCHLGYLFNEGKGVPKDPIEAANLWGIKPSEFTPLLQAAERGEAEAQLKLGKRFRDNCKKDAQSESHKWLEKAAQQGITDAKYMLGEDLRNDKSNLERQRAIGYLRAAANEGHPWAQQILASHFDPSEILGNKREILPNQTEAEANEEGYFWALISQRQNDPESMVRLYVPIEPYEKILSKEKIDLIKARASGWQPKPSRIPANKHHRD
ncbi:MAG: sel1 repeat family protein [Alphaproteobacteria bacterium]|nr:sel1 repeat family protein [Alphaproteobacteria bacterium]